MRCLPIVIAVLGAAILAPSASSAAKIACGERVVHDWSDNGRIDRVYALPCYEGAIAALPTDLRDYTNAYDVIGRAMSSAARGENTVAVSDAQAVSPARAETIDASGAVPVPIPLVVLFGLALALLAAGALARVGRAMLGRKETRR